MWQYNYDYLCHKANYKYIDKYRDKKGNWVYIYNEPETVKRKMADANRRGAEAAEKARGRNQVVQEFIKGFPSVIDNRNQHLRTAAGKGAQSKDLNDYDKAEKTKQALKKAADKAASLKKGYEARQQKDYEVRRQKEYEANAKGAEAAEKAKGRLHWQDYAKKYNTSSKDDLRIARGEEPLSPTAGYKGAKSKDLYDYDKAEKTKQALKNATDKAIKRQKQYEANAEGAKEAEKARGMVQQQQQITKRKNAAKEQLSVAYNKIDEAKKQILKGNYDKASEILNEGLNMSNEAITMGELGDNNYMDLVNEMLRDPKVNKKIYKDKVLFAPTYRK